MDDATNPAAAWPPGNTATAGLGFCGAGGFARLVAGGFVATRLAPPPPGKGLLIVYRWSYKGLYVTRALL
jgi:hypothetical protein